MSWLSKVTDIAGKAEEILNRLDQSAGEVIDNTRTKATSRGASQQRLNRPPHEVITITEEVGRAMPSQTHSEYIGGGAAARRKHDGAVASASHVIANDDDELMAMLREQPGQRPKSVGGDGWPASSRLIGVTPVEMAPSSHRGSAQSIASMTASEALDAPGMRTQLLAKDSQLTMLRNKLTECEKKLEKRGEELWDLKREKEALENEVARKVQPQESLEELRLARQKAIDAREAVVAETGQLRKKLASLEEENSTIQDQLRLAKFNLTENKREFDEYKDKAAKILQAKEKLVESLKQGNPNTSSGSSVIPAELEELRVERDMARADLESCQLQVYNLRGEMDEQQSRTREEQRELADQRRALEEERAHWNTALQMLNEKIECARVEQEFTRAEMRRQESDFSRRIEEKENELRRTTEELRVCRHEDEYRAGVGPGDMATAEKLLQKQADLEHVLRENQVLALRLERLQKSCHETSVGIGEASSSPQPTLRGSLIVQNPTARQALSLVDTVCFKFVTVVRNYPAARLFLTVYFIVLHFWVFFILLTYAPEVHN